MRILVTGGAGFIGSHVARRFSDQGHEVAVIDNLSGGYRRNIPEGVQFGTTDLTEPRSVDFALEVIEPELVVHCAAYAAEGLSHWMRSYCYTQNLIGWANLANAAVRHGVGKIVALSSMAVYGAQQPPFTENLVPQPEDPYGAAKAAMETDLRALARVHGIDWGVIRPHNVYGPGQNLADPYRNVVAIFCRQALAGEPITVFGDGTQIRAFSYIAEVSQAICDISLNHSGVTVNVGGEEPVTVLELAERIQALTGTDSPIVHLPPRHEVHEAYSDHTALRELLGHWAPTPFDVGLKEMVDWARTIEIGPRRTYDYEVTERLYPAWV